jgi:hypothetical protein
MPPSTTLLEKGEGYFADPVMEVGGFELEADHVEDVNGNEDDGEKCEQRGVNDQKRHTGNRLQTDEVYPNADRVSGKNVSSRRTWLEVEQVIEVSHHYNEEETDGREDGPDEMNADPALLSDDDQGHLQSFLVDAAEDVCIES